MMLDRNVDGHVHPGFMPTQLGGVLGVGSFDSGLEAQRFDALLGSGGSLSVALRDGWLSMVSSITAARGGIPPTEGALASPVASAGVAGDSVVRKPQNVFTSELELAWYDALDIAFKALPTHDLARAAWLNSDRFSTQWVSAIPSPSLGFVLGNDVFCEVFATYLALPSPACAPLVGQRIGGYREGLDRHGINLATLSLPGDGWRKRHDALQHVKIVLH